ncbi:hydrogen peroxide-inducible genes activator [Gordonia sp. ABSL1-1]|uniref:hydrogen peroxide-inducible genes activator n=1 Tax=Gordonia sp. ABSL1-1 TaxID=3053923 RepID=UPI0025734DB3|nr:hydrogen peroxide-inducible genes activator [Gordonia sp. ABSL1-1]MDL9936371.1 hydrogen peroxide-inducible genes activator [Gordonia sp. ABSL1-1]
MVDKTYQPSLAGLRAFVALARRHHFGTAATDLGVSQPSLSQALAALEKGLGVTLIERTTRRVLLTPDGERLLPRAAAIVEEVDMFVADAGGIDDSLSGVLRLGLIPTVAPYILPTVLRGLARTRPELSLRVVEDQTARLTTQLREGAIDVAVLALPAEIPGTVEIPMYDEDFVLALPSDHPFAGRRRVDPASLADLPLLLLDEGHCLRDQALEVCRLAGVRPDLGHTRAASLTTAVHCVEGGLGVTLIPQTAVASETAGGGLATATFTTPRPGRRIGLVFRRSARRESAYRELAQIIAGVVAETGTVRAVRA